MKLKLFYTSTLILAFISCTKKTENFTKEEIVSYSKEIGFPENNLYFIKP